ncbi:hypothetical protein Nepgr_023505 [Nepenthes gracilis]|uniref:U1-type domain-containing protein n=1 Tax=Nepenthes gracilis TaxID=150966 RepID=A0AAD3T0U4_NEPGR|nr:hypothetical protein Nepgr_023505 [Nepenthes gracilis]
MEAQQQRQDIAVSQPYDPSQLHAFGQQSTEPYYSYQHHNQPHQNDYSYYYPDYSNSYQFHPQTNPISIHPPGVPIPPVAQQTHVENQHNVYYRPPQPQHGYMPSGQPVFGSSGSSSQGGRPLRGSGRGNFGPRNGSFRGRGRGGGRGRRGRPHLVSPLVPFQPAGPPLRTAWCELCRVDCTTPEFLDQHKNGKKHKKNMKVYEELQNPQNLVPGSEPEVQPEKLATTENAAPAAVAEVNNPETQPEKEQGDKSESSTSSLKRIRTRGGRGGKWMRIHGGLRRAFEPPKSKRVGSLLCELCNIRCDSRIVFANHMAGKKHLSNMKRFQGHRAVYGGGVRALYPPIPNVPSTLSVPEVDQGRPDAQTSSSALLNRQGLHDAGACPDALAQVLNQHGIQDPQALLAQLIPLLLSQSQGTAPAVGPSGAPISGVPAPGLAAEHGSVDQAKQNSEVGEMRFLTEEDKSKQKAATGEGISDKTTELQSSNDLGDASRSVAEMNEGFNDKTTEGRSLNDLVDETPKNDNLECENALPVTVTEKLLNSGSGGDSISTQEPKEDDAEAENRELAE